MEVDGHFHVPATLTPCDSKPSYEKPVNSE